MNQLTFKKEKFTAEEIQRVAALHKNGIKSGFLSSLGENFLKELYLSIAKTKDGVLIVALNDGQVVGFVSGAVSKKRIMGSLLKNSFGFSLMLLPAVFSFRTIKRIMDLLVYSLRSEEKKDNDQSAELLSLAIDEKYRRQGIAHELFEQLAESLQKSGVIKFKIVVGDSLIEARRFYEKMGAQRQGSLELHKDQTSSVYIFDMNDFLKSNSKLAEAGRSTLSAIVDNTSVKSGAGKNDYIRRYSELFQKLGQPSIIVGGVLWTSYQKMIVPVGPVCEDYAKASEEHREELLGFFKDCILIRSGSGFVSTPEDWYSVICDRFTDLSELSLKSRAQVRRGLRNCIVLKIEAKFLAEYGWPVLSAAFRRYKNTRLTENEQEFKRRILLTEGFEDIVHYWGVFEKETGRFVSYAENYLYDKTEVNYWTISFHPDFLRLNISHALLYEMNKYYLEKEKFGYSNNGFRSLLHQTGIQDYLLNKFLYKKQPVGLKIYYRPSVGKCLLLTYPCRNLLGAAYPPLGALYKLEEIRRGHNHVRT